MDTSDRESILARFEKYVLRGYGGTGPGGSECWIWVGKLNGKGYPYFKIRQDSLRAHRVVYELLVGPIPDGLTLDHLCRVRACVNPGHLELVTARENVARGCVYGRTPDPTCEAEIREARSGGATTRDIIHRFGVSGPGQLYRILRHASFWSR